MRTTKTSNDNEPVSAEGLEHYNAYRRTRGLPPVAPTYKYKRPHMLQLSDNAWEGLGRLAVKMGYTHHAGGNVTALLEALGHDLLEVYPPSG